MTRTIKFVLIAPSLKTFLYDVIIYPTYNFVSLYVYLHAMYD